MLTPADGSPRIPLLQNGREHGEATGSLSLVLPILVAFFLPGLLLGCSPTTEKAPGQNGSPHAEIDTANVRVSFSSFYSELKKGVFPSWKWKYTKRAILSVPGRSPVEGRESILQIAQHLSDSLARPDTLILHPGPLQVVGPKRVYQQGTFTVVTAPEELPHTPVLSSYLDEMITRGSYHLEVKKASSEWKYHRLFVNQGDAASPAPSSAPSEKVLVLSAGGGLLPLASVVDGEHTPAVHWDERIERDVTRRRALLLQHRRYVMGENILTVTGIERSEAPGSPIVGRAHVTDSLTSDLPPARLDVGDAGGFGYSVAPGTTPNPRDHIPTPDTTLTSFERDTIADYAARQMVHSTATDGKNVEGRTLKTLKRRASALLKPGPDSSSSLQLDVTSGDFDGDGSVEYMVLGQQDDVQCSEGPTPGTSSDGNDCERTNDHAFVLMGRLSDGNWDSISSTTRDRILGVQNLDAEGAPEVLMETVGYGHSRQTIIRFKGGALEEMASYEQGS